VPTKFNLAKKAWGYSIHTTDKEISLRLDLACSNLQLQLEYSKRTNCFNFEKERWLMHLNVN